MEDRYSNIDALRQTKDIMCKDFCQPQIHILWWHIFPHKITISSPHIPLNLIKNCCYC